MVKKTDTILDKLLKKNRLGYEAVSPKCIQDKLEYIM
jgi:hypothetical protein